MNADRAISNGPSGELVEDVSWRRDNPRGWVSVFDRVNLRRRAAWTGMVAVAVMLGFVAVSWFLNDRRPGLTDDQRYGLDVSHHQGAIDWNAVAADDIDFVYIKATEGGDWVDRRFAENWDGARAAGLDVGAYHFFTLCRSGRDQAANFLETVRVEQADLPLAIDLEFAAPCSDPLAADELRSAVLEFIDLVEDATGQPMLVYLLDDFDEQYRISDVIDHPRWVRSLYRRPDTDWAVWQYTYRAQVDGIEGGVDLNVGDAEL